MPAEKTERNEKIVRDYIKGITQRTIAREHGISVAVVWEIIQRYRAKQGPINKPEEITKAAEQLDYLIEKAVQLAEMDGAPVTAGKDGLVVVDPERTGPDGKPVFVRDYSGNISAMALIKTLQERKSRLLGLDSATKTEVSGTVDYRIPGLDPKTLQ